MDVPLRGSGPVLLKSRGLVDGPEPEGGAGDPGAADGRDAPPTPWNDSTVVARNDSFSCLAFDL